MPSPLERFRATDRTVFDTTFWQGFLQTLVAEIESVKATRADYEGAIRALNSVGLQRINEALLPAYNEIAAAAHLGALFSAHSASDVTPAIGNVTFVIDAEARQRFAPAGYLWATETGGDRSCAGAFVSYNPETGHLVLDVDTVRGTGAATSWQISLGVPPARDQVLRWQITADGGETLLAGIDDDGMALRYVAGSEGLYVNGVRLVRDLDYTADDGETATLNRALAAGAVAEFTAWAGTREIASGPRGLPGAGVRAGTSAVNFGAGGDMSSVVIAQPDIVTGSVVQAWLSPVATADHSVDEHIVEELDVFAHSIVPGAGFTITARTRNKPLTGLWTVAWTWK